MTIPDTGPASQGYLRIIILLALGYALAGRLGLMLAIPPGYATAIFPSAGIALGALLVWGYKVSPGIFLGSLTLNIWISLDQGSLSGQAAIFAVSAASGALLQAIAGCWLSRRLLGNSLTLSNERQIFGFFLIGGPLACMVNASFGAGSLLLSGIIPESAFAFSWFTWWIGNSMGVLIATPLLLIAFARPRALWKGRTTSVALPLCTVTLVLVGFFIWTSKWEQSLIEADFKDSARQIHGKLQDSLGDYIDTLASTERLFASSERVSQSDFRNFLQHTLVSKPGIHGISWNPVVRATDRETFIADVREEDFPDYQIFELAPDRSKTPAPARDQYVVVRYIEPLETNRGALGLNVAANPARREALKEAARTGKARITERITLVQDKSEQAGFLVFYPAYFEQDPETQNAADSLRGFVVGVLRLGDIVDAVLSKTLTTRPNFRLSDVTNGHPVGLYGKEDSDERSRSPVQWQETIHIGGRTWEALYWPDPRYFQEYRGWQAWAVLVAGLLLVSLFCLLLLAMSGRTHQVQELVTQRTSELHGIVTTATETILTVDASGRVQFINPAGLALLGYQAEELTGAPLSGILPDLDPLTNSEAGNEQGLQQYIGRRETVALTKDQVAVPIELGLSSFEASESLKYTAVIHDLTARKQIERMKDEFIATVSHELRTPLTSIKGGLSLMSSPAFDTQPEKREELLKIATQNCARLEGLVNDLLSFAKLEATDLTFSEAPLSLFELVQETLNANLEYARQYDVSFVWKPGTEADVSVKADEARLAQALTNLLSNAAKYSPKGGRVLVSSEQQGDRVRVSVTDRGEGISADFQEHIFEKFSQADSANTRKVGGTGLGLAITKKIIEKHGGSIGFETHPGQGTTFYFELPLWSSDPGR